MMIAKFAAGVLALALGASPALASPITVAGFGGECDLATCNGFPVDLPGVSTNVLNVSVTATIAYAINYALDQPPEAVSHYSVTGGIFIWDVDGDGVAQFIAAPGQSTVTGDFDGLTGVLSVAGAFTFDPTSYVDPQELWVDAWAAIAGCTGYCQGTGGGYLGDTFGNLEGNLAYPAPEPSALLLLSISLCALGVSRYRNRVS